MGLRTAIPEFALANPLYVGSTVDAWTVTVAGVKTAVRANLYAGPTGTDQLANPQILDGDGKFAEPVYIEDPVILEVDGPNVSSHDTGVIFPRGTWRGNWATATIYYPGDWIVDGVNGTATNSLYIAVGMHTSGVWAADAANATKLKLVIDYPALSALVVPDAAVGTKGKTSFATRAEINADDADEAMIPSEFLGSKFDPNGKHCVPLLAGGMQAATTNGAAGGAVETTTNKILYRTFDFDGVTQEFVGIVLPAPKSWNELTMTARFRWTATAGTPGQGVVWAIQAVAVSDDDAIDTAWGTEQVIADTLLAVGDMHISAETPAFTVGGSPAAGDTLMFRIKRNPANASDTMSGADARLIGVDLFMTTDTGTDA